MAKAINCEHKKKGDIEPCNKCEICLGITNGSNLDLIEIDAASTRGIDDIRELRNKIKLSPTASKKKVYVIDEVHMLTLEAFNALLKTLEEPPEHAVFILCTTEPHKLPATIISRCLRLNFSKPTVQELSRSLEKIIDKEKLYLEPMAIQEIIKYADGSFRDAVKLLEQLSFSSKKITLIKIDEFFGQQNIQVKDLLSLLQEKKLKDSLMWLNKAMANGSDVKILTISILEFLRKMLLSKLGIKEELVQDNNWEISELKSLINLFSEAGKQLKDSVIAQLPLEIVMVEWCSGQNQKTTIINQRVEQLDHEEVNIKAVSSHKTVLESSPPLNSLEFKNILDKWPELLKVVKTCNHSIEALLKAARPVGLENNKLIVEVFYPFHKSKLEKETCLQIIEAKLKEIFNQTLIIKYKLSKSRKVVK